jgi:hypothetical protein
MEAKAEKTSEKKVIKVKVDELEMFQVFASDIEKELEVGEIEKAKKNLKILIKALQVLREGFQI